MAWTVEDAFDKANHVTEARKVIGEYEFQLAGLPQWITLRTYRLYLVAAPGVHWDASHFIKTPLQASPYMSDVKWADTEEQAVVQALRTFTEHYQDAMKKNLSPSDSWLVPNKAFAR